MHPFRYTLAAYLVIFSLAFPKSLFAATITTTACTDGFDNGTYSTDTECSSDQVQLDATGKSNGIGYYTSEIFDAESSVTWQTLAWSPEHPNGKHLTADSGYTLGNFDMTDILVNMYFDESSWDGTADEAVDNSGNAYHGVRVGDADTTSTAKLDRAADFDGSGDYVDVGTEAALGTNTDKTVSFWIQIDTKASAKRIFTKNRSSHVLGYGFAFESDGDLVAFFNDGGEARRNFGNLSTGQWYHLTAVYDESAGTVDTYVDGASVNGAAGSGWGFDSNDKLLIGGRTGNSQYFDGRIDEFVIFDRALSSDEIEDLFLRGSNRLEYQVRVCDDAACSGESFLGPDGTTATWYTERTSSLTAGEPSKSLTNLQNSGEGQYFQYYAKFETDNSSFTPELLDLTITHNGGESVPEFSDMMYMTTLGICIWFVYRKINDQGFGYA